MKRIDQICGLPVIDIDSGGRLGQVSDVVLNARDNCLAGIEVKPNALFQSTRYLSFTSITLLGDVSVLVHKQPQIPANQKKPIQRLQLGQKVYGTDGFHIGWLTNALIEETDGKVHSLEVSKGYFDDLLTGRCWISEFSLGREGITVLLRGRA